MIDGFLPLALALACLLVVLVVEWNAVLNYRRLDLMSLQVIERKHPRFPGVVEIIMTSLLTIAFLLLFIQFISRAYALSLTLDSSTAEMNSADAVIVADFDGDGDLDYAAHNDDPSVLNYYTNDGTGTFSNTDTSMSAGEGLARGGDLDADGDMDFVIFCDEAGDISKVVNDGNGGFTQYVINNISVMNPHGVIGDFNGDGALDFVIVSDAAASAQALYVNDRHGDFTAAASTLPAGKGIAAADFNSDGHLDIAIIDSSGNMVSLLNSGTGAFVSSFSSNSALVGGGPIVSGDFDGDGAVDVVVSDGVTHSLQSLLNNGTATSFSQQTFTSSNLNSVLDIAAGDMDNDGDLDIIAGGGVTAGGARLFLNNGSGVFTENGSATQTGDPTVSIGIGDIDNDGDLDYIRGNGYSTPNRHYKSDQATTSANTAPAAPSTGFTGALVSPSPKNGGTFVADSSIGTQTWSFPSYAGASDNAKSSSTLSSGEISYYLKATNFNFGIPSDATILGIKVGVEKSKSGLENLQDNAVRIVKGGTIGSTDKSDGAPSWPSVDTYSTYGGPADLWGETWTASDINSSTFGFAISARNTGGSGGPQIDHIRITVYYSMRDVRLTWGSGSDTQTSTKMLQYQIRIGTGSSAHNIVSSKTASPSWVSRIMPNGQSRMALLHNLPCGKTFYWNVASVDSGFKTTWGGTERLFTLSSDCTLSFPAGSSGGNSTTSGGGGGLPWNVLRQEETEATPTKGTLSVTTFNDVNGDGVQQKNELASFAGLPVTASGATLDGVPVKETILTSVAGTAVFRLPPSDDRGYTVIVETGSNVLAGQSLTTDSSTGGIVLQAGDEKSIAFGFRSSRIVHYKPCLTIGSPAQGQTSTSEASALLSRIVDPFGQHVIGDIAFSGSLVTRHVFLTLLARTHCLPLILTEGKILTALAKMIDAKRAYAFADLPMDLRQSDSVIAYSLLAAGIHAERETAIGPVADLSSPVTRGEAVQMVFDVLAVPPERQVSTGAMLPSDLDPHDPLVTPFLTLASLQLLPPSFLTHFGSRLGVSMDELAVFLARAAFAGGKIALLAPVLDPSAKGVLKGAAPPETFLAELPPLKPLTCLHSVPGRSDDVVFSDVAPDHSLFADIRELLRFGYERSDGKVLWLIPGTSRLTEYGIAEGEGRVGLAAPVSLTEILRSLLVLSCIPPPTAIDVLSGKAALQQAAAAERRVARDLIADLPRDGSLTSRVLYRAQDHERAFDLSILGYAPDILRGEKRDSKEPLNMKDASDILASALLRIAVKQAHISSQHAEGLAAEVAAAIRRDLMNTDLDWRDEALIRQTVFTRGMLVRFLATLILHPADTSSSDTLSLPVSLGEIWWERVKR